MSQDPRWSADTEQLVERRLCILDGGPGDDCAAKSVHQEDAQGVLTALADAGMLVVQGQLGIALDSIRSREVVPRFDDYAPADPRPASMLRAVEFDTSDEPAAPRVWAMPEIPDDVQRVTATGGDIIASREPEDPRYWEVRSAVTGRVLAPYLMTNQLIAAYGPLTEADGSGT